jgi:hypothetical protein
MCLRPEEQAVNIGLIKKMRRASNARRTFMGVIYKTGLATGMSVFLLVNIHSDNNNHGNCAEYE